MRPLDHLVGDPEHLPQWVISEEIIFAAIVEASLQDAALRGAHRSIVIKSLLRKRARFPPLEACGPDGNPIDGAAPARHISANIFQALAAKGLTIPGHVFFV